MDVIGVDEIGKEGVKEGSKFACESTKLREKRTS